MRNRLLSLITAVAVAVTMIFGGTGAVFAAGTEGGLLWYYKDSSTSSMQGVSSPVTEGSYVYMASGKTLYKFNAATGAKVGSTTLSGSIGYNKLAPTAGGGKVFVPLGGAKLDIVNASSMKLEKTVTYASGQTGHQSLTPAVYSSADNAVYLGSWRKDQGGTYAKVSLSDYSVTKIAASSEGFYWSGACADDTYVVFGSASDGTDDPNTPASGNAVLYAYDKTDGTLTSTSLTGSGSICSTVVKEGGKYYFTSKSGRLYEATIAADGTITAAVKRTLAGKSTCTPVISGGKAYIGSQTSAGTGKVEVINLTSGALEAAYNAPADVKTLALSGDKIYVTYNKTPGGLYDVKAGKDYFVPYQAMQNYCISAIAQGSDGTLYYTNDSNYLMAVKSAGSLITAQWKSAGSTGALPAQSYTGKAVTPALNVKYNGKTLTSGTDYTVTYSSNVYPGTAQAVIKGKGNYQGVAIMTFTIKAPVVAAQKTVTTQLYGYDDILVKWSSQKVAGATVKYRVEQRKYGGSWTRVSNGTTAVSIKRANLADGVRYAYRITPYVTVNGKTYYGTAKTSSWLYTLKTVKKPAISKASKNYVKVKWSNIPGETGYQIYRSRYKTKKFVKVKTVSAKYSSVKIKTPRKKTYYYKVRAYKKVGSKYIYGPWSSVSKAYKLK